MAKRVVYEAVQPVVDGNQVVTAAGDQFGSLADVPDGVQVRAVIADVPGEPEAKAPAAAAKPAGKSASK